MRHLAADWSSRRMSPHPQGGSSTLEQVDRQPIKEEEQEPHTPLIKDEELEPQTPYVKEEEEEPQAPYIKEEEEEPQPPCVKEEEEEVWITQEGEHLLGPEEADLTRLPLTGVSVKTDDHEDKPPESSQLHHSPSEEMREAEPSCSSSLQHMTTEADGDHCGGSQADNLLAPLSDSDDTTSHSPEDEDSDYNQESLSSDTDWEGDMTTHTGNKHSESSKKKTDKPFNCSVCHKTFSRCSDLDRHMRTHTGEKPFSCSVCGKCFAQKATMQSHMRIHTGEKPFSCSDCGKCFAQKTTMQSHMRMHTREKPFSCSDCGKRFTRMTTMHSHLRTHTDKKAFTCSNCGKTFSWKCALRRHMQRH
uniref:oocyte zinc finger protein XlCOF7.1-like n=1 Tax=Doryrhamphus excisus TaxID=161450 RepID=UPI0025AE6106|nr:oocyte zinc finger protein XlCOF7.1-like [Doryrhamphus excisus]